MVKKNFAFLTVAEKKLIIEKAHPALSMSRQAELLALSRSSISYVPRIDPEELNLLSALDQAYTKYPFYGSRRLKYALFDE
ncbi:MAG: hypothetical protein G01um101466_729 [Parcubacteria group bacterium Gr01-1014_66]|nr:MAG: hypothetical protein G01um101466_729 [Parcubacteria group bacterium Gr01-1014_66]